ncbi:hypothetical protein WJX72_002880 [[Myrmecia] bisecta]|uniref:MYND-type domain-containing protein n=1 Tax=[Myrmecia] bisecta TaxID=41462 RepID=A0AAW1QBC1_9CHLO
MLPWLVEASLYEVPEGASLAEVLFPPTLVAPVTGSDDTAPYWRVVVDSLAGWQDFCVPPRASETGTFEERVSRRIQGLQTVLLFGESWSLTVADLVMSQGRSLTLRAIYRAFRQLTSRLEEVDEVVAYCAAFGLVNITQVARPSEEQLKAFARHMAALEWVVDMFKLLFCTEVISRGQVLFDWGRRLVCNRLGCPRSQAWLAEQHPGRPNLRLAFEAFAGTKLRKCGACETAYYCCPECSRADWGQHKPFCRALRQQAAS